MHRILICLLVIAAAAGFMRTTDPGETAFIDRIDLTERYEYDAVDYDLDGDGEPEHCVLYDGPTYGIFSVLVVAAKADGREYRCLLGPLRACRPEFSLSEDGLRLHFSLYAPGDTVVSEEDLAIGVENGEIVIEVPGDLLIG